MAAAAAAAATAARAIRREEKAMKKAEKEDRKESESKHISTAPDGSAPVFNKRTSISTLVELQIPNRDAEQDISPKCSLDQPRNNGAGLLVSDSYPWQVRTRRSLNPKTCMIFELIDVESVSRGFLWSGLA